MATSNSPILSQAASGSLADLITFQRSGGKTSIRKKPHPHDPATPLQQSVRAVIKVCPILWANMSPALKALWGPPTHIGEILFQNLLRKVALQKRASNLAPCDATIRSPSSPTPAPVITSTLVSHHQVTINFTSASPGLYTDLIFEGPSTTFTSAMTNVIQIKPTGSGNFILQNVKSGVHHYRLRSASTFGSLTPQSLQQTITVP